MIEIQKIDLVYLYCKYDNKKSYDFYKILTENEVGFIVHPILNNTEERFTLDHLSNDWNLRREHKKFKFDNFTILKWREFCSDGQVFCNFLTTEDELLSSDVIINKHLIAAAEDEA